MAEKETKRDGIEREYTIPLRKEWGKVPRYKRANKAMKAIKEFLARHMKVEERDLKKIKLDKYLNEEVWFRGIKKPPAKIKIKARKENGIVKAELAEMPETLRFKKAREEKEKTKASEAVEAKKKTEKKEEKDEEKTEEQKREEKEKTAAVAESMEKMEKDAAKKLKHQTKQSKQPKHRQRVALQK